MGNRALRHGGLGLVVWIGLGCASSVPPQQNLPSVKERNLTVGTVQKEIRKGMDQGAVAEVLGAPNIVSSDKEGKETWIYDKISSEVSYSRKQGYLTLILFGRSSSELAASSAQKTLTIVIKFDDQGLVDTFSYHTSKF